MDSCNRQSREHQALSHFPHFGKFGPCLLQKEQDNTCSKNLDLFSNSTKAFSGRVRGESREQVDVDEVDRDLVNVAEFMGTRACDAFDRDLGA